MAKVTDGRVYCLKFLSGDGSQYFWMQEPSDEKDDEYAQKINNVLS